VPLELPQQAVFTDTERPREACGIFGIYAPGEDVSRITFFGLFALQHRGQESAGIASTAPGRPISLHTAMGLVNQAFRETDLEDLKGDIAIGHTRYSTMGAPKRANAQPIAASGPNVDLALGHNGNVINASDLRNELSGWGLTFGGSSDSEVIAQLYANAPAKNWADRSAYCMRRLRGAYSLVLLTNTELVGVRDPLGIRPLCLGKLPSGYVLASESCALDHIGAEFVREIEPGETVVIDAGGLHSYMWPGARSQHAMCIFEHIYFSRPDSILDGQRAYAARLAMGAELAKLNGVEADLVIGVPDSATAAAVGYSRQSGIPYGEGLVKNRYVGRTFIQPDQRLRDLGVQLKFNPVPEAIAGKRLVVVDDSIVRGTTTPRVIKLLRHAGAREIHMRICAPPIISTCHFGVDMGRKSELIAAQKSVEEIRTFIDADTLGFLDMPGLLRAVGVGDNRFCRGCFTGVYPIPVQLEMDKMQLEKSTADAPRVADPARPVGIRG
jgi:amidophosphoribosyltransferase